MMDLYLTLFGEAIRDEAPCTRLLIHLNESTRACYNIIFKV